MAIEFNCPYCTATIRVPDASTGKQGRCPKCETKLLIPGVPLPNQPMGEEPTTVGQSETASQPLGKPRAVNASPPLPAGQIPNGLGENVAGSDDPFAIRQVPTSAVKSRHRSARRRPSRTLVIGVPVICFLILFGIIAYSLTASLPQLHGELIGHRLEGLTHPKSTIPWSDISLSKDDRKILQDALSTQPESLTSQALACRLSANDDGIVVTLAAQPESQWIMVDVRSEKPLAIWRRKEGPQLNRFRLDELRAAVKQYAKDKLLTINGEQIAIDAMAVRDKVALNASCLSLSYAIQAIADSAMFPCAAENELGQLYFCLPRTIQSFKIQGRTLANGSPGFHGDYTVRISAETVATGTGTKSAADDSMPETPIPEAEPEMSDEKPETSEPDTETKDSK